MSNSGISPSLRNSRKLVAILAVAAVLVAIGGISQNDGFKFLQGQMSGVKSDETIMSSQISPQKTISTLTPVITKVNSVKTDVSSTYSSVNPKVENIAQSKSRDAYGITSTQNTLTQKTWNIVEYRSYVFDSSWNLYVGTRNQITYYNFEDNTKKTWTLPNEHSIDGSDSTENPIVMALDSKGNLFYPDYDPIKGISNITKLDTTSNIFRIYSAQAFSNYFAVDSSDNIIAQNYKLNLNDNTYSHWFANCGYAYLSPSDIEICSGGSDVRKFDYETGSLTTWTLPEGYEVGSVTADSSGNIYFTEQKNHVIAKVGKITVSDNSFTEWVIPGVTRQSTHIVLDSSNNVYFSDFNSNSFYRLVPSTDTFTKFANNNACAAAIHIDSSNQLHCLNPWNSMTKFY